MGTGGEGRDGAVQWAAPRCGKWKDSALVLALSPAGLAGTCHLISLGPSRVGWKTRNSEQTEMDAPQTAFETFQRCHLPTPARLAAPFLRFPIKPLGPAPQNRSLGFKERKTNSSD